VTKFAVLGIQKA